MEFAKRIAGGLATLLGGVGVVAALAGCFGVWAIRGRLDRPVEKAFNRVDGALERLKTRASHVNQRIDGMQESMAGLNDRVQRRVAAWRNVPTKEAADIDQIERQLYARIQHVRDWIEFMQASVEFVSQLLEMAEATSGFLRDDSRTTVELAAALRSGYGEIEEATELFEQLQVGLADIRASRDIKANARRINTISSSIDRALENLQRHGRQFEDGVAQARTDVAQLGDDIRWRMKLAAVISTLLLLWMAAGQACLAQFGWRLIRQPYGGRTFA
jgi:chromosome segregation ATPase